MNESFLTLQIITPDTTSFSGPVKQVSVPTTEGVLTILPEHTPVVVVIQSGELVVTDSEMQTHVFAVFSGVLDVRPGSVVNVLVDKSEKADVIDIARAEQAVARAKVLLEEKIHENDVDFARFQALLDKELNRVRVATKWRM